MKVITGNRLDTGRVIYLGSDHQWVDRFSQALLFSAMDDAQAAMDIASTRTTQIADLYIVEANADGIPGGREALKETIRNLGPTMRTDLGKQAGNI